MRIGIVPNLEKNAGGIYQYSLTMLDGLLSLKDYSGSSDSFIIFTEDINNKDLIKFKKRNWEIYSLSKKSPGRLLIGKYIRGTIIEVLIAHIYSFYRQLYKKHNQLNTIAAVNYQRQWFQEHSIDLIIYPTPNSLSFQLKIPYIFTIHDLQHRLHPEFPEVSAKGEWEKREGTFTNGIKNALLVLVDSKVGQEDVLRFYKNTGIIPQNIKILPFLPAIYIDETKNNGEQNIHRLYHLPENYFFYPAQFWPHKNHLRIIKALGLLFKKNNLNIPLVLSGSYSGKLRTDTFKQMMMEAERQKIDKNIYYIGYIDDRYMASLYKNAIALIMPTFFGPTNIPILEAWKSNCPVITSDIPGVRDQAADAAVLVAPASVASIADGIYRIWTQEKRRTDLIKKGRKRLALYTKDDYNKRLKTILNEAKSLISKNN